jgi:hypothetical protein
MEPKTILTTLSTEILQMIIEESIPEGFEALSLTCRTLHEATERYIPDYQRLKQRFHRVSYADHEGSEIDFDDEVSPGNPLAHMLELTSEPLATRFVQFLDLEYRVASSEWSTPDARFEAEVDFMEVVLQRGHLFHLLQHTLCRNDFHVLYTNLLDSYSDQFLATALGGKIRDFKPPGGSLLELMCLWDDFEAYSEEDSDTASDAEKDEIAHWFESMLAALVNNTDYATIVLLSLLPNVKFLNLRWTYDQDFNMDQMLHYQPQRMWTFLSAIATNANDATKPSAGLSNLTTFSLSGGCVHTNSPAEHYLPILTINSLQSVHMYALVLSRHETWPNCPSISMFGQNIKSLMLTECLVRDGDSWEKCLAALISRMPKLKTLKLHLRQPEENLQPSFMVPKVVDVICEHLGESLETLSISGTLKPGNPTGLAPGNVTMTGFKRLETVELDIRGFSSGGPRKYPSLVHFLPSSIVSIILLLPGFNSKQPDQICETTMDALDHLLVDFESEYETKLPSLDMLILRGRITEEFYDRFEDSLDLEIFVDFEEETPAAFHLR